MVEAGTDSAFKRPLIQIDLSLRCILETLILHRLAARRWYQRKTDK